MKEIDELKFPDNVRYSEDHEWARPEGDLFVIGISDYAQDQLGDIVFVELPEAGAQIAEKGEFGSVESVKAVSELFAPIGGEVVEINTALEENPELVNEKPYDSGWMIKIKPADAKAFDRMMDHANYIASLKG